MSTPSTICRIQQLIEQTRSDLDRFATDIAVMAPASRISPQNRITDLHEALRLLDGLTPPGKVATPVDTLRVALDYGVERSWPKDLRELVARLLPEMRVASKWCVSEGDLTAIRYAADDRHVVVRVARENQRWRVMYPRDAGPFLSMEDAQAAGDQMVEGEWALCGGAVRPTNGVQASGEALPVTPLEEGRPDASWLRHVRRNDRDVRPGWVYEGPAALQLAAHPDGRIPLLTWLDARGQLIGDPEYFQVEGLPRVRIVTRAPLDGDWCPACGDNMDGHRFLRIVRGEEAWVCGGCAEDSDGGWP